MLSEEPEGPSLQRILLIAGAILIPVVILGVIALATCQPGLPTGGQNALAQYLQYQTVLARPPAVVQRVKHAAYPERFSSQLSAVSYGEGVYYRSTYDYQRATDLSRATTTLSATARWESLGTNTSLRPLPYPPQDLWCVLLTQPGIPAERMIYVGLHQDLYVAAWVVHEPAKELTDQETQADLARLGCEMKHSWLV